MISSLKDAFHYTSMNISLTFCCIIIMLDALIASLYFKNYAGIMDSSLYMLSKATRFSAKFYTDQRQSSFNSSSC